MVHKSCRLTACVSKHMRQRGYGIGCRQLPEQHSRQRSRWRQLYQHDVHHSGHVPGGHVLRVRDGVCVHRGVLRQPRAAHVRDGDASTDASLANVTPPNMGTRAATDTANGATPNRTLIHI